jgi:HD-GYP domain-containing protein (c-di-GMP phosphodiesterase class II)
MQDLITKSELKKDMLFELYEFTNEIICVDSLDSVIDAVIKMIKKVTGCLRISIMLLSEDGNYLYIKKAIGLHEDIIKSTKIKIGEKIAGRAFSGKEIISSDFKGDKNGLVSFKEKGPFMSIPLIEVPSRDKAQPIGVINLTNKSQGNCFSEEEKNLLLYIANTASISLKNALRKEALEKNEIDTLILLINVIEARDKYTQGHSNRVGKYACEIADRLGFTAHEIKLIKYAGQLHDIGKIEVPDSILLKNGKLTDTEYEIMKKHPVTSKKLVDHISYFDPIKGLFLHHHEHYNGKGYPDCIGEDEIELGARILAVADAYDAMTSNRPYREAMQKEKAVSILINEKRKQFDPECVDAFLDYLVPKFPHIKDPSTPLTT